MKRLAAALLLLAVAVGFSLWSGEKITGDLRELSAETVSDPWAAYSLWQEKKPFLRAMLNHQSVDEAEKEFQSLKSAMEKGDEDSLESSRESLIALFQSISERERLSFSNIF